MPKTQLEEFLEGYTYIADDFDYEMFKTAAAAAHKHDMDVEEAQIGKLNDDVSAADAALTKAKLHNYDLLQSLSADPVTPDPLKVPEADAEAPTIESFFGTPKE